MIARMSALARAPAADSSCITASTDGMRNRARTHTRTLARVHSHANTRHTNRYRICLDQIRSDVRNSVLRNIGHAFVRMAYFTEAMTAYSQVCLRLDHRGVQMLSVGRSIVGSGRHAPRHSHPGCFPAAAQVL